MPTTYSHADPDDYQLLDAAARRFNPDLVVAGARVLILFAASDESPPLVRSGDACAAIVSVIALQQRMLTHGDALIRIDRANWDMLHPRSREALLAH